MIAKTENEISSAGNWQGLNALQSAPRPLLHRRIRSPNQVYCGFERIPATIPMTAAALAASSCSLGELRDSIPSVIASLNALRKVHPYCL